MADRPPLQLTAADEAALLDAGREVLATHNAATLVAGAQLVDRVAGTGRPLERVALLQSPGGTQLRLDFGICQVWLCPTDDDHAVALHMTLAHTDRQGEQTALLALDRDADGVTVALRAGRRILAVPCAVVWVWSPPDATP